MGKRYRSIKEIRKMHVLPGKAIKFKGHLWPPRDEDPCSDPVICRAIEAKPGYGILFWLYEDDVEKVPVTPPQPPAPDTELMHIKNALKDMHRLGVQPNPKLLERMEELEEEVEVEEEPFIPLSKTTVNKATKRDLHDMIDRFGFDIEKDQSNPKLREAILRASEEKAAGQGA